MSNRPPTPPPTTETELHDEDRMPVSSPPVAAAPVPLQVDSPPRLEIYRDFLHIVEELISKKDFQGIVRVAEIADIKVHRDHSTSRLLTAVPLILGFLINDDAASARYAILRLPDNLASFPPCRSLLALAISTAHRQYRKVYEHAQALQSQATSAEFGDKELGLIITSMVPAFMDNFRQRALKLLTKSYTSLPLALASVHLGIRPDEIVSGIERFGWTLDPLTQVLHSIGPKSAVIVSWQSSKSSLGTFDIVADSVAKLEA